MKFYKRLFATGTILLAGIIFFGSSAKALEPGCERQRLRTSRLEFSNGQTTVSIEKGDSNGAFDTVDIWISSDYQGNYQ